MDNEKPDYEMMSDEAPAEDGINGAAYDPLSMTLTKPIQAHGEEITMLRWREPTGGDIERAGNPLVIDSAHGQGRLSFDERKMANMISTLTAIPPSSVRQISAKDWNTIAWRLIPFFAPTQG